MLVEEIFIGLSFVYALTMFVFWDDADIHRETVDLYRIAYMPTCIDYAYTRIAVARTTFFF